MTDCYCLAETVFPTSLSPSFIFSLAVIHLYISYFLLLCAEISFFSVWLLVEEAAVLVPVK